MEFVCGKCAATQSVPFPDGRFAAPQRCVEMGCRSRTFAPNRTAYTCIDWQRVSLQVCVLRSGSWSRTTPPAGTYSCCVPSMPPLPFSVSGE